MACNYLETESIELPLSTYVVVKPMPRTACGLVYYAGPLMGWTPRADAAAGYQSWADADAVREAVGGDSVLRVYGVDFSTVRYRR